SLPFDPAFDQVQDKLDPAVFFYQGYDAGNDDGNDRDIIHGCHAVPHYGKHLGEHDISSCHAHDQGDHDPAHQHKEHIDPDQCSDKHHKVRQHFPQIIIQVSAHRIVYISRDKPEIYDRYD